MPLLSSSRCHYSTRFLFSSLRCLWLSVRQPLPVCQSRRLPPAFLGTACASRLLVPCCCCCHLLSTGMVDTSATSQIWTVGSATAGEVGGEVGSQVLLPCWGHWVSQVHHCGWEWVGGLGLESWVPLCLKGQNIALTATAAGLPVAVNTTEARKLAQRMVGRVN